jgi:hypothetical protein
MNWAAIFRGAHMVLVNHSLSISFEFSNTRGLISLALSSCTQAHAIYVSSEAPLHVSISGGKGFPYSRIEPTV